MVKTYSLRRMKTILADPNIPLLELFESLGKVITIPGREWTRDHVKHADVLLTRSVTKVNRTLLDGSPVQFVGTATSGFDHIDREYLQAADIQFEYCPGSNAVSVAEYVIAAVLLLKEPDQPLNDMSAGIVGYGHVGQAVAAKLRAVGIRCMINDPPRKFAGHDDVDYVSLETALSADVVTLHTPLEFRGDFATCDLINSAALAQIKSNGILINAARGRVINEAALLERINTGAAIKTAIDCWQGEPAIDRNLEKIVDIATPHIAGYSYDGKLKATRMLYNALCTSLDLPNETGTDPSRLGRVIDLSYVERLEDVIPRAISAAYDVKIDHQHLLTTLDASDVERAKHFDHLRKNYPQRREFDQYSCDLPAKMRESIPALRELGFHIS